MVTQSLFLAVSVNCNLFFISLLLVPAKPGVLKSVKVQRGENPLQNHLKDDTAGLSVDCFRDLFDLSLILGTFFESELSKKCCYC